MPTPWEHLKTRELRGGKITDGGMKGTEVLAIGYDELGNICALLPNGGVRQYLQTDKLQKAAH